MLREALQVLKAMWMQDKAQFDGSYYCVRGAINEPKPVQRPHPPIWIGGAGEKVTLRLVAQYGDACNFNADVPTVRHKLDVLREHCETVGRDYDSVLKTIEFYTILGEKREVDRVVGDTARRTGQDETFIRSWYPWFGDAAHIAQVIGEYVEAGIEYVIVNVPNAFEGGVITRVAEEVFPRVGLRAGLKPDSAAPTKLKRYGGETNVDF
jgi:alkanesulfonate monooxygenase SsuD/methylene tetrahydromethanopterin reductase-like flavin-dependent oxidoreductase (luciferase family)